MGQANCEVWGPESSYTDWYIPGYRLIHVGIHEQLKCFGGYIPGIYVIRASMFRIRALEKDQIEITHKYQFFGIDFYSNSCFEPSSNKRGIAGMKVLMGTLGKEAVVGLTIYSSPILFQGFSASYYHVWHRNLGR